MATTKVAMTGEWQDGSVATYGKRHEIRVEINGEPANLVYEISNGSAWLKGAERSVGGDAQTDTAPRKQKIGAAHIDAKAASRAYKADRDFRRSVG
jgi:hypothetical protein